MLTCNRPKYASLAVRQIAAQDYRPLEVLVVDDGTAAIEPLLRTLRVGGMMWVNDTAARQDAEQLAEALPELARALEGGGGIRLATRRR